MWAKVIKFAHKIILILERQVIKLWQHLVPGDKIVFWASYDTGKTVDWQVKYIEPIKGNVFNRVIHLTGGKELFVNSNLIFLIEK